MTYKGRTLRSLVQCPIGLIGNEDYIIFGNIIEFKNLLITPTRENRTF